MILVDFVNLQIITKPSLVNSSFSVTARIDPHTQIIPHCVTVLDLDCKVSESLIYFSLTFRLMFN